MATIEQIGPSSYGVERDFEIGREQWNVYKLLDGGTVRVKTSVQKIYQVVDAAGEPVHDQTGLPVYAASHKSEVVFSR